MGRPTGIARVLPALVLAVLAMGIVSTASGSVADVVAKMPAYDAATGQPMLEEILKLGPDALKELCSLVTPPQDTSDAKARYAVHGLVLYTKRPGAEADRAKVEKALLDALATAQDPDLKVFFIEQLQLCGSDSAAGALAALLGEEHLCGPASRAMTRIGTPRCVELIRAELPKATGARLIDIVQALGVLADMGSLKEMLSCAKSEDAELRHTAWFALAHIGDVMAMETLRAAANSKDPHERTLGTKYLLLLAQRLADDERKSAVRRETLHGIAAGICRDLLKTHTDPADGHVQCAALWVLNKAVGDACADDLMAAVDGKNVYVREAAMAILQGVKGEAVTRKLIEKAGSATGAAKAALITVLGLRGDKSAAPVVMTAMDDKDAAVSAAAMKAAALLAPGEVLKLLTARMKSADPAVVAAAKGVLTGLKAEGFDAALAAAMPDASPAGKVALIELLGARGATAQSKVVFDALNDSDPVVRKAAAKALALVAVPTDIDRVLALMLAATDEGRQTAIQGVLVSLCRKANSPKCVLDALPKADAKQKPLLLATLARIGGADALAAVTGEMGSADAATKDAAARALADWQGAEAIGPLVKFAGQTDSEVHRVLAIRGIVRLVGRDTQMPAGKAVSIYTQALAAAKKPAEKGLVIGALGGVQNAEALTLVAGCLDDADVRELAAAAAIKIASPAGRRQKGLTGPAVREAMEKVVSVSKNAAVVEQAKKYLATMSKGK